MAGVGVKVVQTDRKVFSQVKGAVQADAEALKASSVFAVFDDSMGNVRVTGGVSHGTKKGISETEAIVRIEMEPIPGDITHATFKVSGNVEIGMSAKRFTQFLIKNKFFNKLLFLKVRQFIGAIGEWRLVKQMNEGAIDFHVLSAGANSATDTISFRIVPNSVTNLQHSRTKNGLDIIAKIENPVPPPPDFWAIFEVKTSAFHGDDGKGFVQMAGPLSDKQKDGIDYAIDRIKNALSANFRNPLGYIMDTEKKRQMRRLLAALQEQRKVNGETTVMGFVVGQGLDQNFQLVKNLACPQGMASLSLHFGSQGILRKLFNVDIPKHPQVKDNIRNFK
ncbi:MAG: hypothetical protein LBN41_10215 [Enterobacteriaceae bacterium]|jgi:hypothetical protein|nr:hypothetical protein [Enterobacteriaceae bacterium]